jgi:hypothetical protein
MTPDGKSLDTCAGDPFVANLVTVWKKLLLNFNITLL